MFGFFYFKKYLSFKRMKSLTVFFFSFLTTIIAAQTADNFTLLQEISGDLDKDSIAEKVQVFNTTDTSDMGIVRELRILNYQQKQWKLWKSSRLAIMKSEEGGMMGDPFESISIKKGILIIEHFGGSSWKWSHTDKYRFQNGEFQLIGYTSTYGKPCNYWINNDFNLSTGKYIYKKEPEACEGEESFPEDKFETETFIKKGIKLNLNNRYSKT
jgi:hypothetical protein